MLEEIVAAPNRSAMELLNWIYGWVWGLPLIVLLAGLGLYLTVALRGIQFFYLGYALKLVVGAEKAKEGRGDISHFQALMTALAATIGIGNIAGISTALVTGGPGAIFWMWLIALIGMSTKYAEAYLALRFRIFDQNGEAAGGPMYFIERGLKWRGLAAAFAWFGAVAAFGGGNMIQANSIADALQHSFSIDPLWTGLALALCTGLTLIGGIRSIGWVASLLVPFMAFVYMGGALVVIGYNIGQVPEVLRSIFVHAFTPSAPAGAFLGVSVLNAIQVGAARGLMTSEAGMGTASIAAAAAKTDVPGYQALISMTGSFLATIVLCTITALALGVTGVFGTVGPDGKLVTGAALSQLAFESVFSWGGHLVTFGIVFFGFTTLLGWAYYGEKCLEYLFGERSIPYYRFLFTCVIFPGALLDLELVWKLSDITNGLMAIPNLIGIAALSGVVVKETRVFLKALREGA